MKHVFFAFYDGREYTRIDPAVINYYLSNGADVYAVIVNLREVKAKQQIEIAEGVYFDLVGHVIGLEIFDKSIRATVSYYAEGDFNGQFTKEYNVDESQITRIKL